MNGLVVLVGALVNAVIIGFFARRMIGVPVGWPRTIVLSLAVNFGISPLLDWFTGVLHLEPVTGHAVTGPAEFFVVLLVILWVIAFEVMALAVLEALLPTGSIPSPIPFVRTMPARWRRARRYSAILRIATRHGLAVYLRGRPKASSDSAVARSLREALTDGGVTFIKLGQMLSTRPDLLPPAYIEELSRLHSNVPPGPWEQVRSVLEAELGRPVTEVFTEVDPQPLAAASVAQVHAGRLRTGQPVVVKIQRPGARAEATADLDIVLRLARLLQRRASWARDLGVVALAQAFADSLRDELDYRVELSNMVAVAATSGEVRVPQAFPDLCGVRLLVMERLSGMPLSSATQILDDLSAERRAAMAEQLFTTVLKQVVITGVFHADLHAGNIFIDADGGVALVDFGAVGRLDLPARTSLSTLLLAVERQDSIAATDALLDLLGAPGDVDDRLLEREVGQVIVQYGGGLGSGSSAQLFVDMFAIVLRHHLSVPPSIAAALRALGSLEGSLFILTRNLDIVALAQSQSRALMAERLAPGEARGALEMQLASIIPMLQRLPRRINRIAESMESGSLTVNVRAFSHEADRSFVTSVVQQLVVAMLAGALALGGIILVVVDTGPVMTAGLRLFTYLGFVLLLFAFVLGSRALALVFQQSARSARRRE